jgi:hypothetical protein
VSIGKAWRSLELKNRKVERQLLAAEQNIGRGEISLLYVDPPWPLSAGQDYPTLTIDAIRNLRLGPDGWASTNPNDPSVADVLAPCSVIAMCAVDKFLNEAESIGRSYGGNLLLPRIILNKRPHTWPGETAMYAHEYLLIFSRGGAQPLWIPNSVWRFSRAGLRHSQKPAELRNKLIRMFPHLTNRLELFARQRVAGWHGWGNQYPAE